MYRYEKKYYLPHTDHNEAETLIRTHPSFFSRRYEDRILHNLYFDTPDLQCLTAHIDGEMNRKKFRLRWYNTDHSQFEIKGKIGDLGYKHVWKSSSSTNPWDQSSSLSEFLSSYRFAPAIHTIVKTLQPIALNSYSRSYWLSANQDYRLTIDSDVRLGHFRSSTYHPAVLPKYELPGVIIELKYLPEHHTHANLISRHLPARPVRISKYVLAMEDN